MSQTNTNIVNVSKNVGSIEKARKNKTLSIVLVVLASVLFIGPPLFDLIVPGSVFGLKPQITDPDYYIGYCKFTVFAQHANGTYEQVDNATIELIDYYNETSLGYADGDGETVYEMANITFFYLDNITFFNINYTHYCAIAEANADENNPRDNRIYLNYRSELSDIDVTIAQLDGVNGTYTMADITNTEFDMWLNISNVGNGSIGSLYYIPTIHRYNETVATTALWFKANAELINITMAERTQVFVNDGNGNSYFMLPSINYYGYVEVPLIFEFATLPTQFEIIDGQWNGTIYGTFS